MFNPVGNKKNYEYIVEQVKEMIINGELTVGEKLPTENELTQRFGVSRTSVREALKALDMIGICESRQGGGSFIVNNVADRLTDNLSLYYILNNGKVDDLIQIRKCIEIESLRNIIEKNDPLVIEELGNIIEKYNFSTTIEERIDYDQKFHDKIILSSGNIFFPVLLSAFSSLYHDNIAIFYHMLSSEKSSDSFMQKEHNDIFTAIKNGDTNSAIELMSKHLEFTESYQKMLKEFHVNKKNQEK